MYESQRKASARYDKKKTRIITLKLNKNTDKDILDFLDTVDNKQGFIKKLLSNEIAWRNYAKANFSEEDQHRFIIPWDKIETDKPD